MVSLAIHVQLLVGQEDLKQLVSLGKNFGRSLSSALEKGYACTHCITHIQYVARTHALTHTHTQYIATVENCYASCVCVCVCVCVCDFKVAACIYCENAWCV